MKSYQDKLPVSEKISEYARNSERLIESLPQPVVIIDADFNILAANSKLMELFKFNDKLINNKCYRVFHNSNKPEENCPMIKSVSRKKCENIDLFIPFLNRYFIVSSEPLIENDQVIGSVHTFTDITDLKEAERNNIELIDIYSSAINEMKAREIKSAQVRDAFFNMLEDINDSYRELDDLFMKLIRVMVNALDAKSPWTKGHSERVSIFSEEIGKEMQLDDDDVRDIKLAGLLHDIGKIGTYDYLLDKPGALTKEEFDLVKKHPEQGVQILKDIKQLSNILPMIMHHHEKLDGSGYPHKIKDDEIPIGAKILHVADSFDSMTSDRPYRKAPGVEFALSELNKYRGVQFDNSVVDAFINVLRRSNTIS